MSEFSTSTLDKTQPESGRSRQYTAWIKQATRTLESSLEKLGEYLNPILVKETRQALKSRQFVITFLIVLLACWIASFAVVAIVGPDVYYVAEGGTMLIVYCMILAFPMFIIVPFSAFRSLSSEQEDNTYDLLSITSLSSRKIVSGKLGSAVVQGMVYMSAVSPCIAFTFLLRGVDTLTVGMILIYYILASLGLSLIGLFAGTAIRMLHTQVLTSVVLVMLLTGAFVASIPATIGLIQESVYLFRDSWFWAGNLAFLTLYVTTFLLIHAAASAQIAFHSENRSTALRWIMVVQQACLIGWLSVPILEGGMQFVANACAALGIIAGIYWFALGMLLTSEWPHLSRRVLRSLPATTVGRMAFTWFNPGPGTGYFFVVANYTLLLVGGAMMLWFAGGNLRAGDAELAFYLLLMTWCYLVIFLGIGRLLIAFARQFTFVSLTAGFLLNLILVLLATGVPQVIAYLSPQHRIGEQFSMLHITNPIWTLMTLVEDRPLAVGGLATLFVMVPLALIVLVLNVRGLYVELHQHRRNLPQRVEEDELAAMPPPVKQPTSPWEEPSEVGQ